MYSFVRFITKQIEKLRLQNSDNKIKGVVGIAHYEEKRAVFLSPNVSSSNSSLGHEFPEFLYIKRGKTRTARNKD